MKYSLRTVPEGLPSNSFPDIRMDPSFDSRLGYTISVGGDCSRGLQVRSANAERALQLVSGSRRFSILEAKAGDIQSLYQGGYIANPDQDEGESVAKFDLSRQGAKRCELFTFVATLSVSINVHKAYTAYKERRGQGSKPYGCPCALA